MNTYILTHTRIDGEVELGYDSQGRLIRWYVKATLTDKLYNWLFGNIPATESNVEAYKHKGFSVKHLPPDLSFKCFWEAYAYKVGNKSKCQQLWKKLTNGELTNGERIQVLESIPVYNRWLKRKGTIDQIYPERYLSQKRYENDFK